MSTGADGKHEARAIGRTIRAAREKRGLSQEELGAKAAMFRTYVWRLEHGETLPSIVTLRRLAMALDTTAWNLLRCAELRMQPEGDVHE